MPNYIQNYLPQGNGGADTTNLGYKNIAGRGGVTWDPSYQGTANPRDTMPMNFGGAGKGAFNLGAPGGKPGFGLNDFIKKQMGSNDEARAKDEANWQGASSYMKQFANPLSPEIIGQMKSENAVKAQGAENNAFAEQQGILAAGGQDDASSLAAAAAQAHRGAQGAQITANTNLGFDAAKYNNQAGLTVGSSILNNLPQHAPDDYSGLAALSLAQQNQDFQHNLISNAYDAPRSPGSVSGPPIDAKYRNDKYGTPMGGGGEGGGFSWTNPAAPNSAKPGTIDQEELHQRLMGGM